MAHRFLTTKHEQRLWRRGIRLIAGVDEVGRGAWAGPLVAAAVIFPEGTKLDGVHDSKQLAPAARQDRFVAITRRALAWSVGFVDPDFIDLHGIQAANRLAFRTALDRLPTRPSHVIFDGFPVPFPRATTEARIRADAAVFSVAAASIVAKVIRDWFMTCFDREHPGYAFGHHKGYGTPEHQAALLRLGLSPIHRRSFCHFERKSQIPSTKFQTNPNDRKPMTKTE